MKQKNEEWLKVPSKGCIRVAEKRPLMVSADTNPPKTAGAIAGMINDGRSSVDIQAIGAGAVNQATKAVAIALTFLENSGLPVACHIKFVDVDIKGKDRTAMRWTVYVK